MGDSSKRRSRGLALVLAMLAVGAMDIPVHADMPVPDSCKAHPTTVVNPGCLPAATDDTRNPPVTLPNLVPEVHDLFVYPPGGGGPDVVLYFDTRAQNFGDVPLDIVVDDLTAPEASTVSQCVAWTGLACAARRTVDGFAWDPATSTARFVHFSTAELRHLDASGAVDYSPAGLIDTIDRSLSCFRDNAKVGGGGLPAPLYPALYQLCPPARQGVTPGWTAAYDPIDRSEQFPVGHLSDGRYAIVARIDPAGHVLESDDGDNVTETIIEFSGGMGNVRVVARYYP